MIGRVPSLALAISATFLAVVPCLRAGAAGLEPFLGLPPDDKPVVVRASFELQDIIAF